MGVDLLPDHLDGATLFIEAAFGESPTDTDTSGWTWTDVTEDVRFDGPVSITRGRSNEASTAQPAKCSFTVDNNDADWTISPVSQYYPNVRRNLPLRVRVDGIIHGLSLPGVEGSYVRSDRDASLDFGGDIDIRIDLEPDTWRPEQSVELVTKWEPESDNRSWRFILLEDGQLEFSWSEDGGGSFNYYRSGNAVSESAGRLAVRFTRTITSTDSTFSFYVADTIDSSWTLLHQDTVSAVSEAFAGDAPIGIGATADGGALGGYAAASVFGAQLLDGVNGTLVADVDFTTPDSAAREFVGAAGRTWTLHGNATMVTGVLFYGYVSEFKPGWDLSGNESTVEITANGSLRRLGQRDKPVRSSMFRDLSGRGNVVGYWPMEDGERAGRFNSGLDNVTNYLGVIGDIDFASYEGFPGADAVPQFNEGTAITTVPFYIPSGPQRVAVLVNLPDGLMHDTEERAIMRVRYAGGDVGQWDLLIQPDGDLTLRGWAPAGQGNLVDHTIAFDLTPGQYMFFLYFEQDGSDLNYQCGVFEVGEDSSTFYADTRTNDTFGQITRIQLGDERGCNSAPFGHLTIFDGDAEDIWNVIGNSLVGWSGETATDRFKRLCDEHQIPADVSGDSDVTMGPQPIDTLMTLLRECETADQGVTVDGRRRGLSYLARSQRESVNPLATIDVADGELAEGFEPTYDDARIVNEVKVQQVNGSSVTVTDQDGPMGVDAVSRYDEQVDLNVDTAAFLDDQAAWRVHLGTVDGYRFPSVSVDMRTIPEQAQQWLNVAPSSRIDLANPDAAFSQLPGDTISLLVEGTEMTISPQEWGITAKCSPYDPWRIITLGDVGADNEGEYIAHLDTVDSALFGTVNAGATSLDIATNAGPLWTTKPESFPFDINIGGTHVTVTGVSGSSSPQTFTVEEIPRDLTDGAVVNVWRAPVIGLGR